MTAPPMADCTSDATRGDDDRGEVRPRARGSTPSRPRENMYRATVLWKDTVAATMLVISSTWVRFTIAGPSWAPARPKITSVSCAWEMPTIWSVPTATVIAQEAKVYSTARAITEAKVAIGTGQVG